MTIGSTSASGSDSLPEALGTLDCEIDTPGDQWFERRTAVFNARIRREPEAIVHCAETSDVVRAIEIAGERELPVLIRVGGYGEQVAADGGLQLDVKQLRKYEIDTDARHVRIGGGLIWQQLDEATETDGLMVPGARTAGIGVTGTALGGGAGWMERAYGPTCASLVGAEVVLADGSVEWVDETTDPEFLWALRGGATPLGVVTELEFELHPIGSRVLGGFMSFPRGRAGEVIRAYRELLAEAPARLGGGIVLRSGGIAGTVNIVVCCEGPTTESERLIAPLRELGPAMDVVSVNEYSSIQRMFDTHSPPGVRARIHSGLIGALTDEVLDAAIEAANVPGTSLSNVVIQPCAVSEHRPAAEMALDGGGAGWSFQSFGLWPPVPDLDPGNIAWADDVAAAFEPALVRPGYPGFLASELDPARLATCFDDDRLDRLSRLKSEHDPSGMFGPGPGQAAAEPVQRLERNA